MTYPLLNPRTKIKVDAFVNNPSHALLISGPEGIGKARIADYIAQATLDTPDISTYPYLHRIEPIDTKLGIEQIRALQSLVKLKIPSNKKISRILIIESADIMGDEAQNTLLKTLEEPPADTIIILLATDTNNLLETVKSRAVAIEAQTPTKEQLLDYFTAEGFDQAQVERAMLLGSNRPRIVREILEENESEFEKSIAEAKNILSGSEFDRLIKINELAKDKQQSLEIIDSLILIARLAMKSAGKQEQTKRWHKILKNADKAKQRIEKNGNTKIILTDLFLNL